MPRDSRWRTVSVPSDELEEWAQIAKRDDPRLPDPFSSLDVIRSLVKLYRKTRSRESGTVRSADSGPVPDRTDAPPTMGARQDATTPDTAESGETYDAEIAYLKEKQKLEQAKANTFYWKARASGRFVVKGETTRVREISESFAGRTLCPKCGVPAHPDLTCEEAKIAVRALGGFVDH